MATAREFSAIGYQYEEILHEKLKVPIRMIITTVGGTMVEANDMIFLNVRPFTVKKSNISSLSNIFENIDGLNI